MDKREAHIQRLMQNLYCMARCRQATFQDILSDYGVTLHQFHLLMHVKSSGKVKVTDLSEMMLVSMPTASRMINSLCDTGLAAKKKDETDRRSTYLELTARGSKVVEEIRRKQLGIFKEIMRGIPESDLEAFLRVTDRIADEWTTVLRDEEAHGTGGCGRS